jgi:hypothetical protein
MTSKNGRTGRPPRYTDKEREAAVAALASNPQLSKPEQVDLVSKILHVQKKRAYSLVDEIMQSVEQSARAAVQASGWGGGALVSTTPIPTAVPERIHAPVDILELRVKLIDHLYSTMQTSPRAEDRTQAAKELGRLTGLHREAVQDRIASASSTEDDHVKCRRLAVGLRKCRGLPLDDLPEEVKEACPAGGFRGDSAGEAVPPLPSEVDLRPPPAEAGVQDTPGGHVVCDELHGQRDGDDSSRDRNPAVLS